MKTTANDQPVNLWDELKNRNRCRHGLVGVSVSLEPDGPVMTVQYSGWQKDSTLLVQLVDGPRLPASDLFIRSPWPAICCAAKVKNRWNRVPRKTRSKPTTAA